MRQAFGVQYGRETLPIPTWSKDFELEDFTSILTNFIGLGADFRTLFYYIQRPDTGSPPKPQDAQNAFWQMQGNLDVNFKVAKRVNMYLSKGLYSGFEIFGLLNILPANGFVKIGKFVPNYGVKIDDHTTFIRQYTGFSPELGRPELTGAEVAVSPGPATVTAGLYNASDGFGAATSSKKAFLGRAEGIFKLTQDVNLGVGGNVFTKQNDADVRTTLFGGFGSFTYRDFTAFGEADIIQTKTPGLNSVSGIVTYIEADYVVTPGFDLKVAYDFYDPDKDLKTGAFSRYSFGFEFFPISGVEVRPLYRILKEDPTDVKNNQFHLMIHFYM
jgi:hypothetical protein